MIQMKIIILINFIPRKEKQLLKMIWQIINITIQKINKNNNFENSNINNKNPVNSINSISKDKTNNKTNWI